MGLAEASAGYTPRYYRLMEGQPPPPCTLKPLEIKYQRDCEGSKKKSGNIGRDEAVVSFEMRLLFTVCERVSDGSNKHATLVERNLLSYWPMSDSYSFHWSFQMSFILPRLLGFSSDLAEEFKELAM